MTSAIQILTAGMMDTYKEFKLKMVHFLVESRRQQPAVSVSTRCGEFERKSFYASARRLHDPALRKSLFPLRSRLRTTAQQCVEQAEYGRALAMPRDAQATEHANASIARSRLLTEFLGDELVICHNLEIWEKWHLAPFRCT